MIINNFDLLNKIKNCNLTTNDLASLYSDEHREVIRNYKGLNEYDKNNDFFIRVYCIEGEYNVFTLRMLYHMKPLEIVSYATNEIRDYVSEEESKYAFQNIQVNKLLYVLNKKGNIINDKYNVFRIKKLNKFQRWLNHECS